MGRKVQPTVVWWHGVSHAVDVRGWNPRFLFIMQVVNILYGGSSPGMFFPMGFPAFQTHKFKPPVAAPRTVSVRSPETCAGLACRCMLCAVRRLSEVIACHRNRDSHLHRLVLGYVMQTTGAYLGRRWWLSIATIVAFTGASWAIKSGEPASRFTSCNMPAVAGQLGHVRVRPATRVPGGRLLLVGSQGEVRPRHRGSRYVQLALAHVCAPVLNRIAV